MKNETRKKKTKEREKVPGGRGGVGWFGALLSPELLGPKGRMGSFFLFPFLFLGGLITI